MKLSIINEGTVSRAKGQIIELKNDLAEKISAEISKLGFRDPRLQPAEDISDDALIYIEVGQNRLEPASRVLMVRIIGDDDIQLQIPSQFAELLKISDYYKLPGAPDVLAQFSRIRSAMRRLLSDKSLRPDITGGNIPEEK